MFLTETIFKKSANNKTLLYYLYTFGITQNVVVILALSCRSTFFMVVSKVVSTNTPKLPYVCANFYYCKWTNLIGER